MWSNNSSNIWRRWQASACRGLATCRYCSKYLTPTQLFLTTALTLQMRKLRHRAVKWLVQGHTAHQWASWELNPDLLASIPYSLPSVLPGCLLEGDTKGFDAFVSLDQGLQRGGTTSPRSTRRPGKGGKNMWELLFMVLLYNNSMSPHSGSFHPPWVSE